MRSIKAVRDKIVAEYEDLETKKKAFEIKRREFVEH